MADERSTLADFAFTEPLRVRWGECDMQGIVFNPHYLAYADVAMTEYLRWAGFPYPEALLPYGADIFAVSSKVDFRSPAKFDDLLTIGVRVRRIGNTSMVFRIAIFRGEDLLSEIETTYVCATPDERKPVPVPQPFRDVVARNEAIPPA
ncbi:acyl-CoA thioester hydrolase [Caulobacter ginsengisoli]|uniref:Acyl-CoA thioester hydrolase n=1 Tax=Caulobacter ginsengisoli TaxID=400775 RepID=A0ABU0J081_9CAUL|nr:thioesterase family protein [Caulobacter ginsengisoli]MDQ0466622.1 acyl-CoA thioester hydrolase [Caulobacter ginsengisoli]